MIILVVNVNRRRQNRPQHTILLLMQPPKKGSSFLETALYRLVELTTSNFQFLNEGLVRYIPNSKQN